jgi:hypothetical protein
VTTHCMRVSPKYRLKAAVPLVNSTPLPVKIVEMPAALQTPFPFAPIFALLPLNVISRRMWVSEPQGEGAGTLAPEPAIQCTSVKVVGFALPKAIDDTGAMSSSAGIVASNLLFMSFPWKLQAVLSAGNHVRSFI